MGGPAEDPVREYRRGEFSISTDRARLDVAAIHEFLSERSYWSAGVPEAIVRRAIANSLCFGLYGSRGQIGFARVVTDRATFAWLCDVYVLEEHRSLGLGKWLVECVMSHPDLRGLRRISLRTKDAHLLYSRFGFRPATAVDRLMEIERP